METEGEAGRQQSRGLEKCGARTRSVSRMTWLNVPTGLKKTEAAFVQPCL
jgi:hypothetical protein